LICIEPKEVEDTPTFYKDSFWNFHFFNFRKWYILKPQMDEGDIHKVPSFMNS